MKPVTELRLGNCANWAIRWPGWVGGNKSFVEQHQPFTKVKELIHATSLEF